MLQTFLLCALILALCIAMLSVRILLRKNGTFVKTHVSQSPEMRRRGISCAQSQDYAARHQPRKIKE